METRKIVVLKGSMDGGNRDMISETAEKCGFTVCFHTDRGEAAKDLEDAEILYSANPKAFAQARQLRWLCCATAGVNQFLKAGINDRPDVLFTNAAGAYGVTLSEHIIMVSLMMMRRMPEYMEVMRAKGWMRELPQTSLFGSEVLILGTGSIGATTAKRIRGFEPAGITGVNRSGRPAEGFDEVYPFTELDRLLPEADLVICCMPETTETIGMISAERIALMKPSAYFVNVGRGSAVDHPALMNALEEGKLAGAALDVYTKEPVPADDPVRDARNLILTPHIAGDETLPETRRLNVKMFCEDLENYAAGRPLVHTVDRKLGY